MLEVLLIFSIVYAIMYLPLRGKTLDQLSPAQLSKVEKNHTKYLKTRKGKKTPDMTIQEYLPILQKQAMTHLITAIIILPIYVAAVYYLYLG